jgi:hypothetical protein
MRRTSDLAPPPCADVATAPDFAHLVYTLRANDYRNTSVDPQGMNLDKLFDAVEQTETPGLKPAYSRDDETPQFAKQEAHKLCIRMMDCMVASSVALTDAYAESCTSHGGKGILLFTFTSMTGAQRTLDKLAAHTAVQRATRDASQLQQQHSRLPWEYVFVPRTTLERLQDTEALQYIDEVIPGKDAVVRVDIAVTFKRILRSSVEAVTTMGPVSRMQLSQSSPLELGMNRYIRIFVLCEQLSFREKEGGALETQILELTTFRKCVKCDAAAADHKVCGKCQDAVYCSRECQAHDWQTEHKGAECALMRRIRQLVKQSGVQELSVAEKEQLWTDMM